MATTGTQRSKDIFSYPRILSDIDSPTHRRKDFSFKNSFADSQTRRVRESPTHRLGELTTPRLAKSGSRWLPDSASWRVSFWLWISPRIWSKIWNGSKGSVRDSWGAGNSAKTPENPPHCHVPLNVQYSWQTSSTYRVAAIFPEHFQSFTVGLKHFFKIILLPQTVSAVCWIINKNNNTHSSKVESAGSYKSRDSLWTSRRTYHERDNELWKHQWEHCLRCWKKVWTFPVQIWE